MRKLYLDKVIKVYPEGGGVFICEGECLKEKHEIHFSNGENGRPKEVYIFAAGEAFSLELTPEELLFIEEQFFIKEIECDKNPLSIEGIVESDDDYSPITKRITLKIKEKDLLITAHLNGWNIDYLTAFYFCSLEKKMNTLELKFGKEKQEQIKMYILDNMFKMFSVTKPSL